MSGTDPAGTPARRFHGVTPHRGVENVPHSRRHEGYFGRMFRHLPRLEPDDPDLDALAASMFLHNATGSGQSGADSTDAKKPDVDSIIPAGYTYLGQFIDHEITFDPTSNLERDNDPDALRNFRTPRLDLDSVYGSGLTDDSYLYETDGVHLRTGESEKDDNDKSDLDLPRTDGDTREDRRALIGDPRNDENVIVAQIHLAFIRFHNRVVEELERAGWSLDGRLRAEAQRIVRWHFQWIVIHDFLPKIVGQEVVDHILGLDDERSTYPVWTLRGRWRDAPEEWTAGTFRPKLRFFDWRNDPFMPVEFSVAAYRFGHSMIRGRYKLNDKTTEALPIFQSDEERAKSRKLDLSGLGQRRPGLTIDWRYFFPIPSDRARLQMARKIDSRLAAGLDTLPKDRAAADDSVLATVQAVLSKRNLYRGRAVGLPSGQAVARAMGMPDDLILSGAKMGLPEGVPAEFADDTPLWYYILREAEYWNDGEWLGPVGGRIVAEVLIGLIYGDRFSYLSSDPLWQPTPGQFGTLSNWNNGRPIFGMTELLSFLNEDKDTSPTDQTRTQCAGTAPQDHRGPHARARYAPRRKEKTVTPYPGDPIRVKFPVLEKQRASLTEILKGNGNDPEIFLVRLHIKNGQEITKTYHSGAFLIYVEQVPEGGWLDLTFRKKNTPVKDGMPEPPPTPGFIRIYRATGVDEAIPPLNEAEPAELQFKLNKGDTVQLVNASYGFTCTDYTGASILLVGLDDGTDCGIKPCP